MRKLALLFAFVGFLGACHAPTAYEDECTEETPQFCEGGGWPTTGN